MGTGKCHAFNTRVAKQCGVNAAVILNHLQFWIEHNRANKTNLRDGRYWVFCRMDAFRNIMDYLSLKQIRTAIEKLEQEGYIIRSNYNASGYDRTTWYAITEAGYALLGDDDASNPPSVSDDSCSPDEQSETPEATDETAGENFPICPDGQIETPERANGFAAEGKSICPDGQMELPLRANGFAAEGKSIRGEDIEQDIETDTIPPNPPRGNAGDASAASVPSGKAEKPADAEFERFWEAYPRQQAPGTARKAFAKARKKVSLDVMLAAIERQKASWNWTREGGQYIPQPASWLNGERWNDNWDGGSPQRNGGTEPPQPGRVPRSL